VKTDETKSASSSEHPAALGGECGTNVRGHFETDVRVLYAREIFTWFLAIAKLLKILVARDGIEPPTPAFSEPLTDWFDTV
jgi:hypothetical protein